MQVNTEAVNENMRHRLTQIAAAAASLAEHAGAAETVRARIVARSSVGADAMELKRFDPDAARAVKELADRMGTSILTDLRGKASEADAAAHAGLQGLEKYRDHESMVAAVGIDPTTLDGAE